MFTYRFIFLIVFFGCTSAACGIRVPQPVPPAVETVLTTGPPGNFLHTDFCTLGTFCLYIETANLCPACISSAPRSLFIAQNHSLAEDLVRNCSNPPTPGIQVEISHSCRWGPTGCNYFPSPCYIVQGVSSRTSPIGHNSVRNSGQSRTAVNTHYLLPNSSTSLTPNNFEETSVTLSPSFAVFLGNFKLIISLFISSQKIIVRNKWDTVGESSNIMHNWHMTKVFNKCYYWCSKMCWN